MNILAYKKAIAAAVGVIALLANRWLGADILPPEVEPVITDIIIGVLTVWGVYQARNKTA